MLVAITGVIGAGKSTLVEGLCKESQWVPFYEPLPETENFMLEAYYKQPEKYAYSMQTLLLSLCFRAQQEAQWRSNNGETCILDSSIYSDKAFLEVQRQCGYIDDMEYKAYNKLCEIHFPFLQYPDLLIHLDLGIDAEIERIRKRSRGCECGIARGYLEKLHSAYDDLIPYLSKLFPIVTIDASQKESSVLWDARFAINNRRLEVIQRQCLWPSYKRNTGY